MAELGPLNPLPVVAAELDQPYTVGEGVPEDLQASARYGVVPNVYPYLMQDGYSRDAAPKELPAVVLENSKLKVTIIPSLGGRIWELFHKATGKQLLHTHDAPQLANIALRKAWFAGGLEWNIGTRGHSPTSCDPLHTAIVHTPDGKHILRVWEYERLREVVFQVDMWLPADSDVLFAAVRLRNPNEHDVPMYWWSNAAIPETDRTRVIAPADEAFGSDYATDITRVRPTDHEGYDGTWLVNSPHAADFFFDIDPSERRWVAAVDDDGDGLAMLSTGLLRGKKLFVWGQGQGGKRWQEWLSPGAGPYAEIQAGLAQTQFEHLVMPAGAEWAWVEAYGNGHLDPKTSHGSDWDAAVAHAGERLEQLLPHEELEAMLPAAINDADVPPSKMLLHGSGWGVVERARRLKTGKGWVDESGTPFLDESVTAQQEPWLGLLRGTTFDGAPSFVAGADWEELLAGQDSPEARFHLATVMHARQDLAGAKALYREVVAAGDVRPLTKVLAHRGLGLALLAEGQDADGLVELRNGVETDPSTTAFLTEAVTLSIRHGDPAKALELTESAPKEGAAVGRLTFLRALALARTGKATEAAAILREGVEIPDLREGEDAIAALWEEVCPGEPVPAAYQFGMH
ncbi:putative tetratricopeptide repeat family protein [Arthrobacter sp. Rue61a]|nr:putative tetratricopeptide repeat family protein [Arthrobacter sp. Rue61a]